MNIPVHRQTDSRVCGATTIVVGQSNVYVNGLLASVEGDINTHANGNLAASNNDGSVFINGKKVVLKGSTAIPDRLFPPQGAPHNNPLAVGASPNVFACGGAGSGGSGRPEPSNNLQSAGSTSTAGGGGGGGGGGGESPTGDTNRDGTTDDQDRYVGPSPGYPEDLSQAEIEQIIRDEAVLRGIDPDTAVAVYRAEGAGSYQSQISRRGNGSLSGKEASFGPYQLYTGGGLGNDYETRTGRNLISDNSRDGVTNQIRYSLDQAAQGGWSPWYGAANSGIGDFEGLQGAQPIGNWS